MSEEDKDFDVSTFYFIRISQMTMRATKTSLRKVVQVEEVKKVLRLNQQEKRKLLLRRNHRGTSQRRNTRKRRNIRCLRNKKNL